MLADSQGRSTPNSVEQAMLAWFPSPATPIASRRPFSETDLRGISDVLRRSGRDSWSRIPRIYATLRIINQLPAIDDFLTQGLSDLWFPFSHKTLPVSLKSQAARCDFLEAQSLVLTKALDLEREDGRHRHFSNPAEIPFQKVAELGKGGFGYVDRVLSTVSYKEYARKLIPRGRTFRKDQQVLRDFEKELAMLKKLSHIHIVELVGSYTDPRYVGILMSPVADYNLKEFLDLDPLPIEGRSFLRTFFGCLAAALIYLHENRIRHKDIKPQNVLVKSHQVFLTDFGISRDWSELGHSTTTGPTTKTPRYCAPEVAAYEPRNTSADMWSLGCVFLEIWSVLCGEIMSNLNTHMASTGTNSSCYYQNRDAISSWCDSMRLQAGHRQLDRPLHWIMALLEERPRERWNAQILFDNIQEANADPDLPFTFTGLCCAEDEDTAESVQSSVFEHDITETTNASSTQRSATVIPSTASSQELLQQMAPSPAPPDASIEAVETAKLDKSSSPRPAGYNLPEPDADEILKQDVSSPKTMVKTVGELSRNIDPASLPMAMTVGDLAKSFIQQPGPDQSQNVDAREKKRNTTNNPLNKKEANTESNPVSGTLRVDPEGYKTSSTEPADRTDAEAKKMERSRSFGEDDLTPQNHDHSNPLEENQGQKLKHERAIREKQSEAKQKEHESEEGKEHSFGASETILNTRAPPTQAITEQPSVDTHQVPLRSFSFELGADALISAGTEEQPYITDEELARKLQEEEDRRYTEAQSSQTVPTRHKRDFWTDLEPLDTSIKLPATMAEFMQKCSSRSIGVVRVPDWDKRFEDSPEHPWNQQFSRKPVDEVEDYPPYHDPALPRPSPNANKYQSDISGRTLPLPAPPAENVFDDFSKLQIPSRSSPNLSHIPYDDYYGEQGQPTYSRHEVAQARPKKKSKLRYLWGDFGK